MPVLHMSGCCVLCSLIQRLQPGRALNHDVPRAPDRNNSARVVDGDAYVSDIGAVLRLEIDMTSSIGQSPVLN